MPYGLDLGKRAELADVQTLTVYYAEPYKIVKFTALFIAAVLKISLVAMVRFHAVAVSELVPPESELPASLEAAHGYDDYVFAKK